GLPESAHHVKNTHKNTCNQLFLNEFYWAAIQHHPPVTSRARADGAHGHDVRTNARRVRNGWRRRGPVTAAARELHQQVPVCLMFLLHSPLCCYVRYVYVVMPASLLQRCAVSATTHGYNRDFSAHETTFPLRIRRLRTRRLPV